MECRRRGAEEKEKKVVQRRYNPLTTIPLGGTIEIPLEHLYTHFPKMAGFPGCESGKMEHAPHFRQVKKDPVVADSGKVPLAQAGIQVEEEVLIHSGPWLF